MEFFRGRPSGGRQLYFTFASAPDPLFKALKAPFLTLRVATPPGAPRQAPLELKHELPFQGLSSRIAVHSLRTFEVRWSSVALGPKLLAISHIQPAGGLKSQRYSKHCDFSCDFPTLFSTDLGAILVAISLALCALKLPRLRIAIRASKRYPENHLSIFFRSNLARQKNSCSRGYFSRTAKRGGFKRGGFPIWTCPSFFVLFCPFWDFPDFSGIFPICSGMVRGFSRFILFLFLGPLRAPTRNSPERVRDIIWTFPEKSGKHPGLETPPV